MPHPIIIIGGGPVGVALGIELGKQGVPTFIFEKYAALQHLPKAQTLNPRSMEFFNRWGIRDKLLQKRVLPAGFPFRGIWCTGLNGKVCGEFNLADYADPAYSAEEYTRIPLWLTEEVLRAELQKYPCVKFYTEHEFVDFVQDENECIVKIRNCKQKQLETFIASYLVACDGANSLVRQCAQIELDVFLKPTEMLNITFKSQELKNKITLPKALIYFDLSKPRIGVVGCTDYENGLWYCQTSTMHNAALTDTQCESLLDEIIGFPFQKRIEQFGFWKMQAALAKQFRKGRVFLAGDAAHIMPPTGGHGLNTGLGDAVNLGWKLAYAITQHATHTFLETYEQERQPIAIRNLMAAKENAADLMNLREKYPPDKVPEEFAAANQRLAIQHGGSIGIALGYSYDSTIIIDSDRQHTNPANSYTPKASAGFFAPHIETSDHHSLYDLFLPNYILLYQKNCAIDAIFNALVQRNMCVTLIEIPLQAEKLYPKHYYLLRPDWHIAWCNDNLPEDLTQFINHLLGK